VQQSRRVVDADLAEVLRALAAGVRAGDAALAERLGRFAATVPTGSLVTLTISSRSNRRRRRARDEMLRRIALEHFRGLDLQRAAAELATDVRRYELSSWRHDRPRKAVPPQYGPTSVRAQLFEAFHVAAGDVPASKKQLVRILKPLFARGNAGTSTRRCGVPRHGVRSTPDNCVHENRGRSQMAEAAVLKMSEQKVLRAVMESAPGKAAAAKVSAEELADRKRLLSALSDLETEERGAIATRERRDDVAGELAAARAKVRELEALVANSTAARIGQSFGFQARRDELHRRLRETASPLIAAFVRDMWKESEKLRKQTVLEEGTRVRSPVTRKMIGIVRSNMAAIVLRSHAIRRAIEDAEALYLQPDQSDVAAKLGSLLRDLPDVDALSFPLRYGSSAMLADLNNGMAIKEALAKHCPAGPAS
jgi:hypothetical protein